MVTASHKKMIIKTSKANEDNTVLIYQQKDKEDYAMLDYTHDLLVQATNVILSSQTENNGFNIDQTELNAVLSNAMNAIENSDTILLSDILYFDLKPLLEQSLK